MAYSAFVEFHGIEASTFDRRYPGAARLIAFDQTIAQPTQGSAVAGGQATAGRVDHGDFKIVKRIDAASPILSLYCSTGSVLPNVKISLAEESEELDPFYEFIMHHAIVRSMRPYFNADFGNADSSIAPLEEIALRYQRIEWRYTFLRADESGRGSIQHYWDLQQNRGA